MLLQGENNIVDFYAGEKILYGRMNRRFAPIELPAGTTKTLNASANSLSPNSALNFVADIFNAMVMQFRKCVANNQISPSDPNLSNLMAHRGYENPQTTYYGYKNIYFNTIAQRFRTNSINVRNFDEFIRHLLFMLETALPEQPLTYPGFIKSRACSIMASGLAVEIANRDYINDSEKMREFVESPNWKFFVSTCDTYGFMVDYNVPWRIVADIESPIMKDQASKYGYTHTLDMAYINPFATYIPAFVPDLLQLYNLVKLPEFVEHRSCPSGKLLRERVVPKSYTLTELMDTYNPYYFLKLYLQMRVYEEMPQLSSIEKEKLIKMQLEVVKATESLSTVSHAFESFIGKTFDKSGSLSYIYKQHLLSSQKKFFAGELSNIPLNEMNAQYDFSSY